MVSVQTASSGATAPRLGNAEAEQARGSVAALEGALGAVVVGQPAAIRGLVLGLLADGHVLLEGVPGTAKTVLARALAAALDLRFHRVQFTPDLMPADLTGARIWNVENHSWELHPGPVFCDVLLADEINRTPPKTQAALLEAMEERQVTIDGERHDLGDAFFVVATSNPLEFEGTYPLPEAQTDRFLLQIKLGYPSEEDELLLLQRGPQHKLIPAAPVLSRAALHALRAAVARVFVDDTVRAYALALVRATRTDTALRLGASPRAGLMLLGAARAHALCEGRAFTLPDDVKATAPLVLSHRLVLSTEAELDGSSVARVLTAILARIPTHPASAPA